MKHEPKKKHDDAIEFSIDGLRVKLSGKSAAVIAAAVAALIYAVASHSCGDQATAPGQGASSSVSR